MLPEDWAKQKKELKKMRRLIVDMLAHCLHNVKHHHSEIVPVLRQDQVPLHGAGAPSPAIPPDVCRPVAPDGHISRRSSQRIRT